MQALNVQFLNQSNVVKTSSGIDDSLKKNESTSSFKSMLEKASKKTEVVNKDVSEDSSSSEQNNKTDKAEQSEKVTTVEKDQENSCLTPKKERITVAEDEVEESNQSFAEPGLETVLVFGKEIVMETESSEIESEIPAATGILEKTSDIQVNESASFNDGNHVEMLTQAQLVTDQKDDSSVKQKANTYEAVMAYSPDVVSDEIVESETSDLQKQNLVSDLTPGSNFTPNKNSNEKNSSEILKDTDKNNNSVENISLLSDKNGNKIISVVDERSKSKRFGSVNSDSVKPLMAESVHQKGNVLDVTMIPVDIAEQNILSSNSQTASAVDSTFQQMLSNQIQQSAPEFVKAGNIILRDNNNGTINMNLKPESLGNVKISLHVSDKGIEGQIVVATKEAFEAFKQNMDTLRHSFQQGGFENTELNLSFNDNSHSNGSFGQERQQSTEQFFANKTFSNYADVPETASSSGAVNVYGNSSHIDVVA